LESLWKKGTVPSASTVSTEPDLYASFGSSSDSKKGKPNANAQALDSMSDPERKRYALALKAAGFKVPTTGKRSSVIALAEALNEAEALAKSASIQLGRTITLDQYLIDEAENRAGEATPGSRKYNPYATQVVYDPTKAKSTINDVVNDLLGRDATVEEVKLYSDRLEKKQSNKASRSVTTYEMVDGVRTAKTTGGLDEVQFLTNIIQRTPEFKKAQIAKEEAKKSQEEVKKSKEFGFKEVLAKTAMANGLNINQFADADQWATRVAAGEPIETFKQTIRNAAKLGLPENVKSLVDQGIDLDTIYSPYKETMASILEINPNSINVNDPMLRKAIGPDKEMSIYEFQRTLKQDPRWQYTNNAREDVSSSVQRVLRDFGFMG
jgi:hypothetical protein